MMSCLIKKYGGKFSQVRQIYRKIQGFGVASFFLVAPAPKWLRVQEKEGAPAPGKNRWLRWSPAPAPKASKNSVRKNFGDGRKRWRDGEEF